jgi:hypothetical protein
MAQVGKLKRLDIREIWQHEARDFSTWLEENIDVLSDVLGTSLTVLQREEPAGAFKVDIIAQDEDGNRVIIENQLEKTDHDHLGKLVTYFTNLDAKKAIWLTSLPRPEHKRSIEWLNEVTPTDLEFYLVRMEAYQIDDSKPAPHFEIEAGPSPAVKERGKRKEVLSDIQSERKKFYKEIHAREQAREDLYSYNLEPTRKAGFQFFYWIYPDKWAVKFYMQSADKERNKQVFDHLYAEKEQIEKEFGDQLGWYRLDDSRTSRIEYVVKGEGLSADANRRLVIQDAMIDKQTDLIHAIYPHIEVFAEPSKHKFLNQLYARAADRFAGTIGDDLDRMRERGLVTSVDEINGRIVLWLNIDMPDMRKNKEIFDQLHTNKEQIETAIGDKLEWFRFDDRRYSQIWLDIAAEDALDDESRWPALQDEINQAEERFVQTIKEHVNL